MWIFLGRESEDAGLLSERGLEGFALEYAGKALGGDGDRLAHELGNVVRAVEVVVEFRVFLRQDEGFARLSFLVHVSDEGARVGTVNAA